jgi:hypothetical protein
MAQNRPDRRVPSVRFEPLGGVLQFPQDFLRSVVGRRRCELMIGRLAEKTESVSRSRVDVHIDPRIGDQSCLDRGYILDRNEGIATAEMHRDMSRDILGLIEMAIDVVA